jgi:hypothetical protein
MCFKVQRAFDATSRHPSHSRAQVTSQWSDDDIQRFGLSLLAAYGVQPVRWPEATWQSLACGISLTGGQSAQNAHEELAHAIFKRLAAELVDEPVPEVVTTSLGRDLSFGTLPTAPTIDVAASNVQATQSTAPTTSAQGSLVASGFGRILNNRGTQAWRGRIPARLNTNGGLETAVKSASAGVGLRPFRQSSASVPVSKPDARATTIGAPAKNIVAPASLEALAFNPSASPYAFRGVVTHDNAAEVGSTEAEDRTEDELQYSIAYSPMLAPAIEVAIEREPGSSLLIARR